jgi:hypothetical protein
VGFECEEFKHIWYFCFTSLHSIKLSITISSSKSLWDRYFWRVWRPSPSWLGGWSVTIASRIILGFQRWTRRVAAWNEACMIAKICKLLKLEFKYTHGGYIEKLCDNNSLDDANMYFNFYEQINLFHIYCKIKTTKWNNIHKHWCIEETDYEPLCFRLYDTLKRVIYI